MKPNLSSLSGAGGKTRCDPSTVVLCGRDRGVCRCELDYPQRMVSCGDCAGEPFDVTTSLMRRAEEQTCRYSFPQALSRVLYCKAIILRRALNRLLAGLLYFNTILVLCNLEERIAARCVASFAESGNLPQRHAQARARAIAENGQRWEGKGMRNTKAPFVGLHR